MLNKYESGRVTPPAEMLVRLADALGTSVDYLLTGSPVDDTQLASSRLSRRFQALEGLAEGDREAIIQVIDAMVVKHRTSAARH